MKFIIISLRYYKKVRGGFGRCGTLIFAGKEDNPILEDNSVAAVTLFTTKLSNDFNYKIKFEQSIKSSSIRLTLSA